MAKRSYKIPDTLDQSQLDVEFYMRNKDGVGFTKPITLLSLFMWFLSLLIGGLLIKNTFIGHGGPLNIFVFIVLWFFLTLLIVRKDKTGRHGFHLIMTMTHYFGKNARKISIKQTDPILKLRQLYGIEDVRKSDGLIKFWNDDTVGYLYHIVGNASALMFDQDKVAVVDATTNFYRKLNDNVNLIYETGRESLNVDRQLESLQKRRARRKQKGEFVCPGLDQLDKQQYMLLRDHIGGTSKSIHQYLIIKAKKYEDLVETEAALQIDASSTRMILKRLERLDYDGVKRYFELFYK